MDEHNCSGMVDLKRMNLAEELKFGLQFYLLDYFEDLSLCGWENVFSD